MIHLLQLKAPLRVLAKKDARCFRGLLISEYFRQCFKSDISLSTNKELAFALASIPPYQVSFSRVKVKHLHHQVGLKMFEVTIARGFAIQFVLCLLISS